MASPASQAQLEMAKAVYGGAKFPDCSYLKPHIHFYNDVDPAIKHHDPDLNESEIQPSIRLQLFSTFSWLSSFLHSLHSFTVPPTTLHSLPENQTQYAFLYYCLDGPGCLLLHCLDGGYSSGQ